MFSNNVTPDKKLTSFNLRCDQIREIFINREIKIQIRDLENELFGISTNISSKVPSV